jgi:acetyl-CoA C-acetyltransferase
VSERHAFVVAARRTPIGKMGGALRLLRVESLVAPLIRAVLADAGLTAGDVDEIVLGNVWGPGGNPARVAALTAGIDARVPGLTIDRQCASGLEAINLAARMVQAGVTDVCLAGGVESASTAPWRIDRPDSIYRTPAFSTRARFAPDAAGDPEMGPAADALARAHGVSRERQDRFALSSHRKAVAAAREGRFAGEIVALPVSNRAAALPRPPDGWEGAVERDQSPRARLTLRTLARFPPVFSSDGTVTAGNASPINDGAALVAVVSGAVLRRLGAPALRIVDGVAAGVDPTLPGGGPIAATTALLRRNPGVDLSDVGLVEITEAFAGQALACLDALGIAEERVNVGGGAIALGHPWGASGAVLVCRLFTEMLRAARAAPPASGVATVAGAGGVGVATLVERVAPA